MRIVRLLMSFLLLSCSVLFPFTARFYGNNEDYSSVPLGVATSALQFYVVEKGLDLTLLSKPNTIYIISHTFNLKGKKWNIPKNCMLVFRGGRIINGVLTGKVLNRELYLKDFIDDSTDITNALYNSTSIIPDGGLVKLSEGEFTLESKVVVNTSCILQGDNTTISIKGGKPFNMMTLNANDITVQDISFKGIAQGYPEYGFDSKAVPMYIIYVIGGHSGFRIENCVFDSATGGVFTEPLVKDVFISGCTFRNMKYIPLMIDKPSVDGTGGYGVVFNHLGNPSNFGVTNGVVQNCTFESSVYRHAFYVQSSDNIKFLNNVIYGNPQNDVTKFEASINDRGSTNVLIEGNTQYDGIVFYNGTHNFKGDIGHDVTIKNNRIVDVTSHRDAIGVINVRSDNTLIIENEIKGVADMNAINMASSCKNVIIVGNYIQMVSEENRLFNKYKTAIGAHASNDVELSTVLIMGNTIDLDSTTQYLMYFRFAQKLSDICVYGNTFRSSKQIVMEDIGEVEGIKVKDNYFEGQRILVERNIRSVNKKEIRNNGM